MTLLIVLHAHKYKVIWKKIDCFFHKTLKYVSDDDLIEYLRFGVGLTFDITIKKKITDIRRD